MTTVQPQEVESTKQDEIKGNTVSRCCQEQAGEFPKHAQDKIAPKSLDGSRGILTAKVHQYRQADTATMREPWLKTLDGCRRLIPVDVAFLFSTFTIWRT